MAKSSTASLIPFTERASPTLPTSPGVCGCVCSWLTCIGQRGQLCSERRRLGALKPLAAAVAARCRCRRACVTTTSSHATAPAVLFQVSVWASRAAPSELAAICLATPLPRNSSACLSHTREHLGLACYMYCMYCCMLARCRMLALCLLPCLLGRCQPILCLRPPSP